MISPHHFRGEEFRKAYKRLGSLKVFSPSVTFAALSGTLTVEEKENIPKALNMPSYSLIEVSPDKSNIYLSLVKKVSSRDLLQEYENTVIPLCDELFDLNENFPVTLLFIPVHYMSEALMYLQDIFSTNTIHEAQCYLCWSGPVHHRLHITGTSKRTKNSIVLTTSIAGLGFDPRNVTHVIHSCPPRNLSQYLQGIGRAGRQGQSSRAALHYSNRDIAKNLPGINDNIGLYYIANI
jgi:ATP-dependent DNA helicase RecQ